MTVLVSLNSNPFPIHPVCTLEVYAFKCFMGWQNISHAQFSERRLNLTSLANHYIRLDSCLKGTTLFMFVAMTRYQYVQSLVNVALS